MSGLVGQDSVKQIMICMRRRRLEKKRHTAPDGRRGAQSWALQHSHPCLPCKPCMPCLRCMPCLLPCRPRMRSTLPRGSIWQAQQLGPLGHPGTDSASHQAPWAVSARRSRTASGVSHDGTGSVPLQGIRCPIIDTLGASRVLPAELVCQGVSQPAYLNS